VTQNLAEWKLGSARTEVEKKKTTGKP